jgi:hypothetical protein
MKLTVLRTAFALTLAALLSACGAGVSTDQPTQTAGLVQTVSGTAQPVTMVATATMPAPDCAAQNCSGLRIVDANAEAYRYDAMRRAAAAPQL